MMFADRLIQKIEEMKNPSLLGLDPLLEYVPESIRTAFDTDGEAILEFNRRLIDKLHEVIPAVKFQSAYYELLGQQGMTTLMGSIKYAKELGMVTILDAKRNDIGSTAGAYAKAYLDKGDLEVDAITVNGYLGSDGIQPFVEKCEKNGKGIFVLVKTSNPSSGELQDMELADGRKVYERMAGLVNGWNKGTEGAKGYGVVGAVVGGTYPGQLFELRKAMPSSLVLIPGYGAQGAGAGEVAGGFDMNGRGAIVNSSRGIMNAWKSGKSGRKYEHGEFCEAAFEETLRMKAAINEAIRERQEGKD